VRSGLMRKAAGMSSATRLYCVPGSSGSVEVYGKDKRGRRVLHAEVHERSAMTLRNTLSDGLAAPRLGRM